MLPGLKHIFGNLHVKHSIQRKVGLAYLTVAAANGNTCSYRDTFTLAAHGIKICNNHAIFGRFVDLITSTIDDRLDPMPYDHFSALGRIHSGITPCPFILNPEVVTPDDWRIVHAMDSAGLLPLPVTTALCNELSAKIYDEKKACHEAISHPQARQAMRSPHLELSGLCVATLAAALNPIQGKRLEGNSSLITSDYISGEMPDAVRFGAIIQMHNDMSDLVKDMQDELHTGMTAPNTLITDIAARGLLEECAHFALTKARDVAPGSYIPVAQLPANIATCWSILQEEAFGIASRMTSKVNCDALKTMMASLPGPLVPVRG